MPTTEEETESDQEGDYKQHNCGNISASHVAPPMCNSVSLASVLKHWRGALLLNPPEKRVAVYAQFGPFTARKSAVLMLLI
jgi:hypothetical protein